MRYARRARVSQRDSADRRESPRRRSLGRERGALRPGFTAHGCRLAARTIDEYSHIVKSIGRWKGFCRGRIDLIDADQPARSLRPRQRVRGHVIGCSTTRNLVHTVTELRDGTLILARRRHGQPVREQEPCDDSSHGSESLRSAHGYLVLSTRRPRYQPNRSYGNGAAKRQGPGRWRQTYSLRRGYPLSLGLAQSAELYDPAAGTSTTTDSLKFAGEGVTATRVVELVTCLLVTGASLDAETYDATGREVATGRDSKSRLATCTRRRF